MPLYSVADAKAVTGTEHVRDVRGESGQNHAFAIREVLLAGEAASSAVVRFNLNRPTAVGTTSATDTPQKINPYSAAARATCGKTWSGAATPGTAIINLTLNAFGGILRWVAPPGSELVVISPSASQATALLQNTSGSATVSFHIIWEEY